MKPTASIYSMNVELKVYLKLSALFFTIYYAVNKKLSVHINKTRQNCRYTLYLNHFKARKNYFHSEAKRCHYLNKEGLKMPKAAVSNTPFY